MNILYVGPYRHNNDYGIQSRLYLESLLNTGHLVTCRPLYFALENIERNLEQLYKFESEIHEKYECLIQQCPLDWAQNHGGFDKNVLIPIMGNANNLKSYQIESLSKFSKIVVDNDHDESIFVRSGFGKNVVRISTPLVKGLCDSLKEKKINLGMHNTSKKFYLFGNLQKDIEIIQKILASFYIAFRDTYGQSLILFLEEASPQDQKNLVDTIKDIKQKLKINTYNRTSSELLIYKNLSFSEKIIAHNTCDILLSFSSEYRSTIQEQHAKYFHNSILNIENVDTIEVPNIRSNIKYYPGDTENSILTQSLVHEMVEISKKNTKDEKYNLQTFNTLSSVI